MSFQTLQEVARVGCRCVLSFNGVRISLRSGLSVVLIKRLQVEETYRYKEFEVYFAIVQNFYVVALYWLN